LIGADADSLCTGSLGEYYQGSIDELRYYNYARTGAQLAYDYDRGAPVAYYKLDECQGATIHDASGNGYDGTINIGGSGSQTTEGTCQTPTDGTGAWYNGAIGKYNSSFSFDGTDDYIDVPSSVSLKTMTISAWINTSTSSTQYISERNNTSYYFATGVTSGKVCFYLGSASANWLCSSQTVTDGTWHHVVGTYDGTTKDIYVDGKLDASTSGSGDINPTSTNINIGVRINGGTPSGYFNGQIDDFRIYNYGLTADQILQVYNQGSAVRFGPLTGAP
jgi:hypothetical protein